MQKEQDDDDDSNNNIVNSFLLLSNRVFIVFRVCNTSKSAYQGWRCHKGAVSE